MHDFRWDHAADNRRIERIDDGGVVYVISDIHLGDGSPSDIFVAKDKALLEFLDEVDREGATLVVAGDAIDFSQAWTFTNILKAHGKVLGAFSALAGKGRLFYILGNHDHDLRLYKDVLRFPVVHGIEIGAHTCILHGYEFDPVIGADIEAAEHRTKMHHLFERILGTWLRLPLEHHYTMWNRVAFWLFHKVIWLRRGLAARMDALFDDTRHSRQVAETVEYWTRCQMGDPGSIFRPAMKALREGPYETLICGHSHLPGVLETADGRRYANTGSWTFSSSAVLRIEGSELRLTDWLSGRRITDRLYQPLVEKRFDHMGFEEWWRDNYLGWLRYRIGEEHRDGKLPAWPPSGST